MRPDGDEYDLRLDGGQTVRLRPLRSTDRDLYERAVIDLSPRSRYQRFLSPIPRPSAKLLDAMTNVDGRLHVATVALNEDETNGVGVVRYVRSADDPGVAEVAIAIADELQGRGLGREMLRLTVAQARQAGLRALRATTLGENPGAQRLLRASGFAPVATAGPYLEFGLRLG